MAAERVKNMTRGNIPGLLLRFSAPMLAGNIFQQLYNMVDSVIVGNYLGAHALGAVGACGSVNFLFFSMCNGMAQGVGILVAQYFGADQHKMVKKAIVNGFLVVLAVALLMGTAGFLLAGPALRLMRTPAEYIEDSIAYLKILCAGVAAVAAYNIMSALLRALGDSKTPLLFLIVSSLINVGLDFLFVLGFHWGVGGAAVATVVSQAVSAILCMVYAVRKNLYFKLERGDVRLEADMVGRCFRLGIPVGLQNTLIAVSTVSLQSVANSFGPDVATAYTMTNRLEQLIQQPYNSLAAGMSTFTGQNIGAGKTGRVKKGLRTSLAISLGFSLFMLGIMQLFGSQVMRLFGDDPRIIEIAARAVRITSCFYFPLGVIYLIRGLCNGAGDTVYSMMNGIIEVTGRIGFAFLLLRVPGVGMWAVWMTTGLTWTITGLASCIRYAQKKWMRAAAREMQPARCGGR